MIPDFSVAGMTVPITGGTGGIGSALARETEISRGGRENPAFNAKVVARIPNGEWAEPHELAGTAIFLASPASRLINGATIPVDGGYSAS